MGLHISVHDPLAVTEVKSLHKVSQSLCPLDNLADSYLEELIDVVSNIVVHKLWIQTPKVRVVDILEYQRRCSALAVPHHIQ